VSNAPVYRQDVMMKIQVLAYKKATDDAYKLEKAVKEGYYVNLDFTLLADKARGYAQEDISNDDLSNNPTIEYKTLIKEYQDAYRKKFDEEIRHLARCVWEIKDEKEKRLRTALHDDRRTVQAHSLEDWHARDLTLTRILQIYYGDCLEQVDINVLLEQRVLIDRYEKYVLDFESRKEVTWPDREDSFRSR
jgi:hypothetical protein